MERTLSELEQLARELIGRARTLVQELGTAAAPTSSACGAYPPLPRTAPDPLPKGRELARYIDHTLLKPEATAEQIERLCREAREHGFAAVCVNPAWVSLARERLEGSGVRICTVVGFPLGATAPEVKVFEAQRAIQAGACEIDMVLAIGALKGRQYGWVREEIEAVAQVCHRAGAELKVILETALLSDEEKAVACALAAEAGADYVKTSTGFGPGGATVEDVALMRRIVGDALGVKAAGGIRTLEAALAMLEAGASRIGASAGVRLVEEALAREEGEG